MLLFLLFTCSPNQQGSILAAVFALFIYSDTYFSPQLVLNANTLINKPLKNAILTLKGWRTLFLGSPGLGKVRDYFLQKQ